MLKCTLYKEGRDYFIVRHNHSMKTLTKIEDAVQLVIFMNGEDLFDNTANYVINAYQN